MEFSKQEMDLFLPLPGLRPKHSFCKMFLITRQGNSLSKKLIFLNFRELYSTNRKLNYTEKIILENVYNFQKGVQIHFQNGKWNSLRKWNYFSHFQTSEGIKSFTNCFRFLPRTSKLISETRNGIIFPTLVL